MINEMSLDTRISSNHDQFPNIATKFNLTNWIIPNVLHGMAGPCGIIFSIFVS